MTIIIPNNIASTRAPKRKPPKFRNLCLESSASKIGSRNSGESPGGSTGIVWWAKEEGVGI
jgi:hypothetical protein